VAGGAAADLADTGTAGAAQDKAGTAGTAASPLPAGAAPGQRAVVSTGDVSLRAADVARARAAVQHVADAYAGQVADQETTAGEDQRLTYARLVLRVPTRSFARAMADLEQVAELVGSSATTEDVSNQVIDVDERVKAARASIERIRLLMSRAERIADVMAIEAQLARREADLDALLRQQAHLADQTSLSTIAVGIERTRAAHRARTGTDDAGFLAGLRGGWHALRGFATVVATVGGALLPWLPVALVVGVPAWLFVRRFRRPSPPAAPAASTQP
jgi:hypothetical protein